MAFAAGSRIVEFRPSDDEVHTVFTASLNTEVTLMVAAANMATSFRLYHLGEGDTASATNAVLWNVSVDANDFFVFQAQTPGAGLHLQPNESIAVKANTASSISFNIYGVTETLAERPRS